jgi:TRAP-type C4-dicarboxylate transport system permease small subunit
MLWSLLNRKRRAGMLIKWLCRVATYVTMVVLGIMTMLTVADVFMRYVFRRPITGTTEITEYLLVCALLGMVPCALQNRHLKVEILVQPLPAKSRAAIEVVTLFAGAVLAAVLAWQGIVAGLEALSIDAKSSGLNVPTFPFYVVLSLSFALMFVVMLSFLPRKIKELLG